MHEQILDQNGNNRSWYMSSQYQNWIGTGAPTCGTPPSAYPNSCGLSSDAFFDENSYSPESNNSSTMIPTSAAAFQGDWSSWYGDQTVSAIQEVFKCTYKTHLKTNHWKKYF